MSRHLRGLVKYLVAFVLGIVTYPIVHEGGHVIGGLLTGEEILSVNFSFDLGNVRMTYVPSIFPLDALAPYLLILLVTSLIVASGVQWLRGFPLVPLTFNLIAPWIQTDFYGATVLEIAAIWILSLLGLIFCCASLWRILMRMFLVIDTKANHH